MLDVAAEDSAPVAARSEATVLRRRAAIVSALFLILPLFVVFAQKGLVVWLALALVAPPPLKKWPEIASWRTRNLLRIFAVLFLWCVVTLSWAPADARDHLALVIAVTIVGGLWCVNMNTLDPIERAQIGTRAVVCLVFTLLLLTFDSITSLRLGMWFSGETSRAQRLVEVGGVVATVALVALVPLTLILRDELRAKQVRFPIISGALAFLLLANALYLEAFATVAALGASAIAFLAVYWRRHAGLSLIGILAIGYLLLAPTIHIWPSDETPEGSRADAWRAVSGEIYDNMLLGHGFASSGALDTGESASQGNARPHNLFLQIWYEFGLVGAVLFSLLIATILNDAARANVGRLENGIGAALFAAFLVAGAMGFGLWDAGWLAGSWLACGMLGLVDDDRAGA